MFRRIFAAGFAVAALTYVFATQAQESVKAPAADPKALKEGLSLKEQILARQYLEFEQQLLRLKQRLERSAKQEDRDRALVLDRVLEHVKEKSLSVQFEQMVDLLKSKELKSVPDVKQALDRSKQIADELAIVITMLREDTRAKVLRDEVNRVTALLKQLEAVIRDQRSVEGLTQNGKTDKGELKNLQGKVTEKTAALAKDLGGKDGAQAKNTKGDPKAAGKNGEQAGKGKDDGEAQAKEGSGKEGAGKEGAGKEGAGKEGSGKEGAGKEGVAKEGAGKEGSGKEGSGKEGTGKEGVAKEGGKEGGKQGGQEGAQAKEGGKEGGKAGGEPGKEGAQAKSGGEGKSKGQAKAGEAKSGQSQAKGDGQPKSGDSPPPSGGQQQASNKGSKSPPSGKQGDAKENPPTGKKQVEDANYQQQKAEEKIEQGKNDDASDNQNEAVKNLEKAKKDLEKLLRQLREEELERLLAALQARCEKMLQMQIQVYNGTETVARGIEAVADKQPTREHKQESLKLSDGEGDIVVEATKAIELLEAEGSAVAFPEVFQQVREDMKHVQRRLGVTDAGPVTVAIEKDIIDTLKEMVEALKKQRQEIGKGDPKDGPPNSGPPPDQKLVDKIAELKMIRSMQDRVNKRTQTYGKMYQGEQTNDPLIRRELHNLSDRQERIFEVTNRMAKGENR